jgi:hypothetical protein
MIAIFMSVQAKLRIPRGCADLAAPPGADFARRRAGAETFMLAPDASGRTIAGTVPLSQARTDPRQALPGVDKGFV